MSTLEKAIILATQAHTGQKDKNSLPYILHPLRVMLKVKSQKEQIIAILHDVVEKSKIKLSDLKEIGFSDEIVNAVDRLSKKPEEPYFTYIERARSDQLSKNVKIADLEDKIEVAEGIEDLKDKSVKIRRYRDALKILLENS
jgi:guanosine-3',5'-bis(diphosphate) 3'-pyrophosphohydrolase